MKRNLQRTKKVHFVNVHTYNLIFVRIAKDSVDEETYAEIAVDAPKKEDTDP